MVLKSVIFFLFTYTISWGMPKSIEVWFLSIDKTSFLDSLNRDSKIKSEEVAQTNLQCQKMGEYCFDPQVGLYKEGSVKEEINLVEASELDKSTKYDFLAPHKGVDRELIECDGNSSFFDIFCGKAKNINSQNNSKFEVWVDVSSTMKQVDFDGFEKQCHRERFLKNLSQRCRSFDGVNIYFFEEYRKQAGMLDRVCLSSGLNQMKNILRDLKISKAEHVLIITDIFEAQEDFINALENYGITRFKGLKTPLYAAKIKDDLTRLEKLCRP